MINTTFSSVNPVFKINDLRILIFSYIGNEKEYWKYIFTNKIIFILIIKVILIDMLYLFLLRKSNKKIKIKLIF